MSPGIPCVRRPARALARAAAFLGAALAGAASAQGFQFSHPALKERGIPVSEYQAIGRTHDAECQARALELSLRRYPATANPMFGPTEEDTQRDRERTAMAAEEYLRCMEAKGWVRVPR